MATIKSYTDISQSKKLAEILPLESADMKWYFWKDEIDAPKVPTFGYSKTAAESYKDTEAVYLPCWSLAALLSIIPCSYGVYRHPYDDGLSLSLQISNCIEVAADDEVDACYELILKLYELKML